MINILYDFMELNLVGGLFYEKINNRSIKH